MHIPLGTNILSVVQATKGKRASLYTYGCCHPCFNNGRLGPCCLMLNNSTTVGYSHYKLSTFFFVYGITQIGSATTTLFRIRYVFLGYVRLSNIRSARLEDRNREKIGFSVAENYDKF